MKSDEFRVVRVVTKERQYLVTAESIDKALELVDCEEDDAYVVEARYIGTYTLLVG